MKNVTKIFNRLANEVEQNKKSVLKLPKCKLCGAYTTSLEKHYQYKHNQTYENTL
jgi:hypothetical protein